MEILERIYRPYFHSEEDGSKSIMLYRCSCPSFAPFARTPAPLTLRHFVHSHIALDIKENRNMSYAKWISRFKLGHSTSTPSVRFSRSQVTVVPDLEADTLPVSYSAMSILAACLRLPRVPSAIVGYIGKSRQTCSLDHSTCNPAGQEPSSFKPSSGPTGKTWIQVFSEYHSDTPLFIVFKSIVYQEKIQGSRQ